MTRIEVLKGLKVLTALQLANTPNFDDKDKANRLVSLWEIYLKNYEYGAYEVAIYLYAKSSIFFPAISQILERMPISDKYIPAEMIVKLFMAEKEDELIKQAFKDCGYTRYDLKQLDTKTIEINVKPRVEKYYNKLVEQDRLKTDLLALESNQKLIGG